MAKTLYRRRAAGWRAYAIPLVLWTAGTLWLTHDIGWSVGNFLLSLLCFGAVFGIWTMTVWSINYYGAMRITTGVMQVGRTKVPLRVLDREWILALAKTEAPAGFEKFMRSASLVQIGDLSTLDAAQGRYIGGAFGSPMGVGDMTLRKTNGEIITMPVKDRAEALTALLDAMSRTPADNVAQSQRRPPAGFTH